MASSTSRLFEATPSLSIEDQANIARTLIAANELYNISNSVEYSHEERQKAFAESSELAKKVLSQLPNDPTALNLAARIDLDLTHHDSAESLLKKALEIAPKDENTLLNYAYLQIAKRNYTEAETIFHSVLESNKSNHRAFSGIALVKLRQKDYLTAFNHYRRLIELGMDNASIKTYFLDSVEFLSADHYQPELDALLTYAFSWDHVDHNKLSNMSASLLCKKYDLLNEHAVLDLDILLSDQLLIEAISKCILPNHAVESLIVELRKSILSEISITKSLRDELLPFAIGLGLYGAKNDYVLMMTQDEEASIANIIAEIQQTTRSKWTSDDVVGALIVISMYEALYTQNFSFLLLRYDLHEWPQGIQALLHANLYELSNEHQIKFDLFGNSANSLLNNEIGRANHRWNSVNALTKSNIYNALCFELGAEVVPPRFERDELKVLIVGCGSGQRAFYLSQYFENISIYAVDKSQDNIAYSTLMANKLGIYDIHFIHSEYETSLISDEQFDIIEFGEDLNHTADPALIIKEWRSLLTQDGLMRFSFNTAESKDTTAVITQLVKERRLSPTGDNIRHLRNAIMQEASSGLWDALLNEEQFYTGSGCKELFFNQHNHFYDLQQLNSLVDASCLVFVGFVDISKQTKEQTNPMAPYSLLAWHVMDQDNALFKGAYQLYCRKA